MDIDYLYYAFIVERFVAMQVLQDRDTVFTTIE